MNYFLLITTASILIFAVYRGQFIAWVIFPLELESLRELLDTFTRRET